MPSRETKTPRELRLIANTLRQDIIRMLVEARSGHTAGPLGMADVLATLYFRVLRHDPENPAWPDRDRLVLSNGHICPVLYAALARAGYFPVEELSTLRKLGSPLQGHPHDVELPGLENSGGPLGQGLSQSFGMALAARLEGASHRIYCLTSDGEHDEGQTWEAVLFGAKYGIDTVTELMDRNHIQIDGTTEEIMPIEPIREKYLAFGWHVLEVDGHDPAAVAEACRQGAEMTGRPTVIVCHTIPGKGVSFMEGKYQWHGVAPTPEEGERALRELDAERERLEREVG